MNEVNRIIIPIGASTKAQLPRSLTWQGDELVDWVGGCTIYNLYGSVSPPRINYAYRFDYAITSSGGEYVALVERLGTKALLLKNGQFLREINRSYYCADAYEYPLAFLTLPDGQMGLAHCPDEYCKLEIEEVETGRRLTQRATQPQDFFHSRLSVSADNRYLASSGWVWHPYELACVYPVEQALEQPEVLDGRPCRLTRSGVPVNMAVLAGESSLIFTTTDDYYDADDVDADDVDLLAPGNIGVYDAATQQILFQAPLEEDAGVIVPLGDDVVLGLYGHPKLIDIKSGKVTARWDDLHSGEQMSCIIHHLPPLPVVAVDAAARRFAIVSPEAITVIQLG